MKTVPEMIAEARELLVRNEHTRKLLAEASEEGQWKMVIQKVYDIGFDNGYEHRKNVEGASKRIKELEAQCWEQKQYGPAWFNSDKFAELIIQKCVDEIEKQGNGEALSGGWDRGYRIGLESSIRAIKKYFGVKE